MTASNADHTEGEQDGSRPRGGLVWSRPMVGRDRDEEHRASTPLELLFDLCFVVAVSSAAASLHHSLVAGQIGHGLIGYLSVFFAIWWAWVNFSWLGSAYDTDDVLYRLLTLLQIAGALVLAAGVPAAFDNDFAVVTVGYALMRVGIISQWVRVRRSDHEHRRLATTYIVGLVVIQLLWIARLALPPGVGLAAFPLLVLLEVLVPYVAERGAASSWHPEHIAERYSLFTLIVLGEVVLSSSTSVRQAVEVGGLSGSLVMVAGGGLLVVFGMWWVYFKHEMHDGLTLNDASAFVWGYGHYLVFAAIASVGASIGAIAEVAQVSQAAAAQGAHATAPVVEHVGISHRAAALALAVGIATYLMVLALLQARLSGRRGILVRAAGACAAVLLIGVLGLGGGPTVLAMGVVLAAVVALQIVIDRPPAGHVAAVDPATGAAAQAAE